MSRSEELSVICVFFRLDFHPGSLGGTGHVNGEVEIKIADDFLIDNKQVEYVLVASID